MAKSFDLEIISPEKTIFKSKANSLVVPAEFGYLGVLADHAPLVANLTQGKITIAGESAKKTVFYSQYRGIIHVLKNAVTLLLEGPCQST